ncbi:hypothetical protein F5Y01DRAFT_316666 [Xylaria sp. FL0043]|nr:hypothetical protein F5Y01DRAFT_316666 [Xylaria sp. FL0043]
MAEVGGICVALASRGIFGIPEVLVISWTAVLVVSLRRQVKPRGVMLLLSYGQGQYPISSNLLDTHALTPLLVRSLRALDQ